MKGYDVSIDLLVKCKINLINSQITLNLDLVVENNLCYAVFLNIMQILKFGMYGCDKVNFEQNVLENLFSQFIRLIYQIFILHVLISFLHPNLI